MTLQSFSKAAGTSNVSNMSDMASSDEQTSIKKTQREDRAAPCHASSSALVKLVENPQPAHSGRKRDSVASAVTLIYILAITLYSSSAMWSCEMLA